MISEIILTLFVRLYNDSDRFLDHYLVSSIMTFVRGFELAMFLMAEVFFLFIAVGIKIRRVGRLPNSYSIKIIDLEGRHARIDGLRQTFSTYAVADRYYQQTYDGLYIFRVVGSAERRNAICIRSMVSLMNFE